MTGQFLRRQLAQDAHPRPRVLPRPGFQGPRPGHQQFGGVRPQQGPGFQHGAQALEFLQPPCKDHLVPPRGPGQGRLPGQPHGVGLDGQTLRVEQGAQAVEFQQFGAVKLGGGQQGHAAPGAQAAVQRVGRRHHGGLGQTAPVAAVAQGALQAAGGAVLAHGAVPQQHAVGAEQPEIVQRLHHRHAAGPGRPHHGGAEGQQRVVDVHGVHALPPDERGHLPRGAAVPHRAQRQQQPRRAADGFPVAALIGEHGMAVLFQQRAFGGKDGVLAAGQPVMAVDQQDLQRRSPPFCCTLPILLLYPFCRRCARTWQKEAAPPPRSRRLSFVWAAGRPRGGLYRPLSSSSRILRMVSSMWKLFSSGG